MSLSVSPANRGLKLEFWTDLKSFVDFERQPRK